MHSFHMICVNCIIQPLYQRLIQVLFRLFQTGMGAPMIDHYDYSKKPEEDPEYIKKMEEEKRLREEKKERERQVTGIFLIYMCIWKSSYSFFHSIFLGGDTTSSDVDFQ